MNRRQRQREFYFTLDNFTYHGYNGLAASVFLVALRDIRYPTIRARNFAKTLMFRNPREDVKEFWDSDWGALLKDYMNLSDMKFQEFESG